MRKKTFICALVLTFLHNVIDAAQLSLAIATDDELKALQEKPKINREKPTQKKCSFKRVCTSICALVCAFGGAAAFYELALPPQECSASYKGVSLDQSSDVNMKDTSWNLRIKNCAMCPEEYMFCVKPLADAPTPPLIIDRVEKTMNPICGEKATYEISQNVPVKKEKILESPGDMPAFRAFDEWAAQIAHGCAPWVKLKKD